MATHPHPTSHPSVYVWHIPPSAGMSSVQQCMPQSAWFIGSISRMQSEGNPGLILSGAHRRHICPALYIPGSTNRLRHLQLRIQAFLSYICHSDIFQQTVRFQRFRQRNVVDVGRYSGIKTINYFTHRVCFHRRTFDLEHEHGHGPEKYPGWKRAVEEVTKPKQETARYVLTSFK